MNADRVLRLASNSKDDLSERNSRAPKQGNSQALQLLSLFEKKDLAQGCAAAGNRRGFSMLHPRAKSTTPVGLLCLGVRVLQLSSEAWRKHLSYLEREQKRSLHPPPHRRRRRHPHAGAILQGCHGVVSFGAHAKRAVSSGIAPVADAGHDHVRLPVRIGDRPDAAGPRHAVEFSRLWRGVFRRTPVESKGVGRRGAFEYVDPLSSVLHLLHH